MIKTERVFEKNKLLNTSTAIISGILTNIIYDEVSETNYEMLVNKEKVYLIVQKSKYNTLVKILIILLIFVIIWIAISWIIPFLIDKFEYLKYSNMPIYDKKYVVSVYKINKEKLLHLQNDIYKYGFESNIIQFADDIICIIVRLQRVFCPDKELLKRVVQSSFRTGASIQDVVSRISPYDYLAIIGLADILIKKVKENIEEDPVFMKDYAELEIMIDDLKSVVQRIPHN